MNISRLKKKIISPRTGKIYGYFYIAVGLINFILILFDYLYLEELPFGSFTLRDITKKAPFISEAYDDLKGIEPHRFTEAYLEEYFLYKKAVMRGDHQDMQKYGEALFERSEQMIDLPRGSGPFFSGKGDGQLEVLKNQMRKFTDLESSREGFRIFFLPENAPQKEEYEKKFLFFEKYMMPVFQGNYFRSIGEDGQYTDNFHQIDIWFVYFFIVDFILRWFFHPLAFSRKWYLFPLRRWYEMFNFFCPHHAVWPRLMRSLPLYMRIRESGLLSDSEGLLPEIIHENASVIAKEISSLVLANIFIQASSFVKSLESGDLKTILEGKSGEHLKSILRDISRVMMRDVLPERSDDIALYLRNIIREILDPWLNTSLAPFVRILLLNLEITIQDSVDAAVYSEKGREENIRLLEELLNTFLDRISDDRNFVPIKENLATFLEISGRELAGEKKNDYVE